MRWLGLPLGRRLTQLEKETAKPEAYAQMQVYAGTLKQSPPPARRVELLQALDTATGASRMAAQMLLDTRLALILGATSRMPEAERPSLAQIMDKVEQGRAAVEQVMPNQTLIQFLYVYRDVADADLQQYVEFARGDPARHFWQAGIEAMTQAFFASAEQFGQRLAEIHAKAGTERAL